ncbi:MAG: hypothetical protein ACFFDN_31345 [Candidatus Hodarchaeota archaeon]
MDNEYFVISEEEYKAIGKEFNERIAILKPIPNKAGNFKVLALVSGPNLGLDYELEEIYWHPEIKRFVWNFAGNFFMSCTPPLSESDFDENSEQYDKEYALKKKSI